MSDLMLPGLAAAASGVVVGYGSVVAPAALDRINGRYLEELRGRMNRLGMDGRRVALYLRWWRAAVLGTFLVFWLGLNMLPLGLMMAFVVHKVIPLWLDYRVQRHWLKIRAQVSTAARSLAGQVRAGMVLQEGLTALARELPDPFGWHLRRVAAQLGQGRGLPAVLMEMKNNLQMEGVTLFVLAVLTAEAKGGKLADVLERTSHSLQEVERVERKREADTAAGRLMVVVLALFPVAFLGLFACLDPGSTGLLFNRFAGQLILCFVGLLTYLSLR
jgi:tight adherence protein B